MVNYCTSCLTPDTRPRVQFNEQGVCNACTNADEKLNIDWVSKENEFKEIIKDYKTKNSKYDCIVPWSGGKDSSYIAYKLKFEYGLNPLLVTFSPLIPNEVGNNNRNELLKLGFDSLFFTANIKVSRKLSKRFFIERGNPKVHWDAGINTIPMQVAVKYDIPLVFYAEHGEVEYGGRLLSEEHRKIRDLAEVFEHNIGDDPRNWVDEEISDKDLAPYVYPDLDLVHKKNIKAMYFTYFFPWDVKRNYDFIKQKINFQTALKGRTDGTFTNYDSLDDKIDDLYYYLQYIKFGFGRATRDSSRLIHRKLITRKDALELVQKYDSEFPSTHFEEVKSFLKISELEFYDIIDKHRNPEIWEPKQNGWTLKFPPK